LSPFIQTSLLACSSKHRAGTDALSKYITEGNSKIIRISEISKIGEIIKVSEIGKVGEIIKVSEIGKVGKISKVSEIIEINKE
jgi:hypothetical protein